MTPQEQQMLQGLIQRVNQTQLPENTRRWVEMLDQASQEAVLLNRKLREILRSQS